MAKKRMTPVITDFDNIPAEALVPEDEQPYEIPSHWKWVRFSALGAHESHTIDPSRFPSELFDLFSVPSFPSGVPERMVGGEIGSTKQIVRPGDVLVCKINPRINRVWVIPEALGQRQIASSEWIVLRPLYGQPEFYSEYFKSEVFRDALTSQVSGVGGSLTRARPKDVARYPVPLPSIEEQKSIVEKLQATNKKIDDVLERLDEFLDQVPQQRTAIIHAGVTGKLTERWRKEHGVSDKTWRESTLGAVADWGGGGTPKKSNPAYWNGSIRWISPKDMKADRIVETLDHIGELAADESAAKLYDSPSICVVTRSGILRRTLPVSMVDGQFAVNQDIKVAHNFSSVNERDFVFRFVQANSEAIRTSCMKSGTTVESIEYSKLLDASIILPGPEEQERITEAIEMALTGVARVVEAALAAKTQLKLAKTVVSARALRGLA